MPVSAIQTAESALFSEASDVLLNNWIDIDDQRGFTKPSQGIYPHQWSWDSAFIAYGYAHIDTDKAQKELRALFSGQWENGFLPHIIFHMPENDYFPGPSFWEAGKLNESAPEHVATSGITQPPVHAMALWHIYKQIEKEDAQKARRFLEEFYPKVLNLHRYFFEYRDPEQWGMITIYHPWESGFDNSPRWDEALGRLVGITGSEGRTRTDTTYVDPSLRPSQESYDAYIFLASELKKMRYDDAVILASEYPFKIKDQVASAILYMSNERLEKMAVILGESTEEILLWRKRYEDNVFERMWNEKDKLFYDYDLSTHSQIKTVTVAGILPLITALLSPGQLEEMSHNIDAMNFCGDESCKLALLPSMGERSKEFSENLYWRGPVWFNTNWLLWKGLLAYKMYDRAAHLRAHLLELVEKNGFWEYYSPLSQKGLGAKNFSWTAALTLDLLSELD